MNRKIFIVVLLALFTLELLGPVQQWIVLSRKSPTSVNGDVFVFVVFHHHRPHDDFLGGAMDVVVVAAPPTTPAAPRSIPAIAVPHEQCGLLRVLFFAFPGANECGPPHPECWLVCGSRRQFLLAFVAAVPPFAGFAVPRSPATISGEQRRENSRVVHRC